MFQVSLDELRSSCLHSFPSFTSSSYDATNSKLTLWFTTVASKREQYGDLRTDTKAWKQLDTFWKRSNNFAV